MKPVARSVNIAIGKNAKKNVPTEDAQLNDVKATTKMIVGDVAMITTTTMMTKKTRKHLEDRDMRKVVVMQVKKMRPMIGEDRRGNVGTAEMKKRRKKSVNASVGKTRNEKRND